MELSPEIPQQDQAAFAAAQKRIQLENQLKSGANWFYWISGLSILNSLIFLFEGGISFVVGLGITQFVDGLMWAIADELGGQAGMIARGIGLVINLVIAGAFVLFGVFSRKKVRGVFILGIVLYALDVLILIWAVDIFSILFHGVALFGLSRGFRAIKQLETFEKTSVIS